MIHLRITRTLFEAHLNTLGIATFRDAFKIGGRLYAVEAGYGTVMRRRDKDTFESEFNDWCKIAQ